MSSEEKKAQELEEAYDCQYERQKYWRERKYWECEDMWDAHKPDGGPLVAGDDAPVWYAHESMTRGEMLDQIAATHILREEIEVAVEEWEEERQEEWEKERFENDLAGY